MDVFASFISRPTHLTVRFAFSSFVPADSFFASHSSCCTSPRVIYLMETSANTAGSASGAQRSEQDGIQSGPASGFASPEPGPGKMAAGKPRRAGRSSSNAGDEQDASDRVMVSQIRSVPRGRGAPAGARSRTAAARASLRSPRRRLAAVSAAWSRAGPSSTARQSRSDGAPLRSVGRAAPGG